ncbi:MAG: M48 family metallopeptidase [Terracidiphilus sp.]|jgi:STE24 endopeptidase
MKFACCAVVAGCLTIQLFAHSVAVAPRLGPAPHVVVRSIAAQTAQPTIGDAPAAKPQQAYTLPPDKLAKAIALGRIRNILEIVGSVWGLVVLSLLLAIRAAAGLEAWTQRIFRRHWLQGLLFFAVLLVTLTVANLPLDIYGHHVGRAYGISVEDWGAWLVDLAKSMGLSLLVGTPALLLFNWIVRRWPRRFWLGCWMAVIPLIVLSTFLEPLIEPLFYHYEPLSKEHPALVAELEKVVARTGTNIPPDRMLLMKASTKTNGLNAYVSGIGATKQIVVFDTTADRIPDDEILFTFAHESGHYVLNHIPKGIALTAVALFFVFWGCAGLAARLVRRCGVRWGVESTSSRAGFVVLLFVLSVAGFLLAPMSNAVSRHFEHQADVYGQEAIHGLVPDPQKTAVAEFNDLGKAWLEDPTPSPFIEFWLYNHPSIQNRANFALHYDPWVNGGHGEFFGK